MIEAPKGIGSPAIAEPGVIFRNGLNAREGGVGRGKVDLAGHAVIFIAPSAEQEGYE